MDHLASIMGTLEAACDQLEQCERTFSDDAEFMAALGSAQAAIARYNAPGNEFARIVRAAPAMLAALQELVKWHENPNAPDSSVWLGEVLACHVRPAIAAATGER